MRTKIKKKPLILHISLSSTLHIIASAQSSIRVVSLHLRRFLFYFHNGVALSPSQIFSQNFFRLQQKFEINFAFTCWIQKSKKWTRFYVLTKFMMDSSRVERASFFSVSWVFCSLRPMLWKRDALSITERKTATGEPVKRWGNEESLELPTRQNSHMHEVLFYRESTW